MACKPAFTLSTETGESAFGTKARSRLPDICGRTSSAVFCAITCSLPGTMPKDLDSDPDDPLNLVFRDGKPSIHGCFHPPQRGIPGSHRSSNQPDSNSHGTVVGAAESFERNRSASESTRRQSALADFGCLDAVTGVAARSFMETQLRENLITFAEHSTPFGILLVQIDRMDEFRASRGPGVVPTILRVVGAVDGELRAPD